MAWRSHPRDERDDSERERRTDQLGHGLLIGADASYNTARYRTEATPSLAAARHISTKQLVTEGSVPCYALANIHLPFRPRGCSGHRYATCGWCSPGLHAPARTKEIQQVCGTTLTLTGALRI